MEDLPLIIGIAGPSASGKTLFVSNLVSVLDQKPAVLHEDAYYHDQSHLPEEVRRANNYDHPSAFEHSLLCQHIDDLIQKKAIRTPVYNFTEHTRSEITKLVEPSPVIIIDGILLLADQQVAQKLDLAIFIDTPLDICLTRRILRDTKERGRNIEDILTQYTQTVRPMYYKYVEPSKRIADLVVTNGGENWKAIEMVKSRIIQNLS
ncbi:MAG: uridine kinase [Gammaproteobacteria bacterium]|nr:uridine kinase [Gammaproteobacteria bacterium]